MSGETDDLRRSFKVSFDTENTPSVGRDLCTPVTVKEGTTFIAEPSKE